MTKVTKLFEPKNAIRVAIGRRLMERRVALRLSRDDVAMSLSRTLEQLANYERGDSRIPAEMLPAICSVLFCSIQWLVTGTELPTGEGDT